MQRKAKQAMPGQAQAPNQHPKRQQQQELGAKWQNRAHGVRSASKSAHMMMRLSTRCDVCAVKASCDQKVLLLLLLLLSCASSFLLLSLLHLLLRLLAAALFLLLPCPPSLLSLRVGGWVTKGRPVERGGDEWEKGME